MKRRSIKRLIAQLMADHGIADGARLEQVIDEAGMAYDGATYLAQEEKRRPSMLWQLSEPLDRVLQLMSEAGNQHGMLQALGSDHTAKKTQRAMNRLELLLRDLEQIRQNIPSPPPKRARGKPSKSKDLNELVRHLSAYWMEVTGRSFTQSWDIDTSTKQRVPRNRKSGLAFVYDVVEFIMGKHPAALPKITAKIVAEHRAATSPKQAG